MTSKTRNGVLGSAAALALVLSACGGGGGGGETGTGGGEPAADGELTGTCTVLQYEATTTAQAKGWVKAQEIFKEQHPDVELEWSTTSFDSIRANAKILLSGSDVPDVLLFNTGNADGGQLAAQGLLDPVTDIVASNGWDDIVTGSVAALAIYDENGHAGKGDWYGVPNTASYFTFYYNKEMLAEHGFETMPETMADLEAMFDALLAEGVTPVSSNAGEHAVLQTWWQLISSVGDREQIDSFILLDGPVDTTSGAFIEGTEKLQAWLEAGYLGSQLAGIKGDEMERAFIAGEFPLMANGTWAVSRVNDEAPFDWGTFRFPEASLNAGASGHLWGRPSNAKNKGCFEAWVEATMTPEVQNLIANEGGIPVAGDTEAIEDERLRAMNEQFDEIKDADALSFYPDYPVPGLLDFQMSELQGMANGTVDAAEFMSALQDFYDAGSAS